MLPLDSRTWDEETVQKLQGLTAELLRGTQLLNVIQQAQPTLPPQDDFKKLPLAQMKERLEKYKVWKASVQAAEEGLSHATRKGAEQAMRMMEHPALIHLLEDMALPLDNREVDERSYALYAGSIWCSQHDLSPEQWKLLAQRFVQREEAELATALGLDLPDPTRERISSEVRRAVWIRDQGKCAQCGSRERLEYDHIVAVSRGGGNTERNIELLCEICNRRKSNSIE